MTTALFMLRCVELGLNIGDLDLLTIGSVNDMFNEKRRDSLEWRVVFIKTAVNRNCCDNSVDKCACQA